ncbi:TPA: endonuclease NucS domain-containing protein, partial [Klebsiella pneumoniae]
MKENELRDLVCERIDILGEDLILLDKEKYLPNKLGTKGFIDIYAKDKQNNHVLIELKRSNQAARQALHEVMKYAEGVKLYFGANDDEIRIIIASTEWSELLVPFS